jgi:hypothetical protein
VTAEVDAQVRQFQQEQVDTSAVIRSFLSKLGGPFALTAIAPDKKGIDTRTFDNIMDAAEWVQDRNGRMNLYWTVNTIRHHISSKCRKVDVAAVRYIHLDMDVPDGEDLEAGRQRILRELTKERPKDVPPASLLIASGNGHQAFWAIQEPVVINGDEKLAAEVERYAQQLSLLFGGDNVHDVCRIMRIPGTWNIPDARKAAKGRVRVMARLLQFDTELAYPLSAFKPAPAKVSSASVISTVDVKPGEQVRRLTSMDELDQYLTDPTKKPLLDRTKVICMMGMHPDEPPKPSRSEWVHDACCQLVRCDVPDRVIFSILTDPECAISASVLEYGAKAEAYALRQVERAKENAVHPKLADMNEKYAVVRIGGKSRVASWGPNKLDAGATQVIHTSSFDDFKNLLMNQKVEAGSDKDGNPRYIPAAKWWLEHTKRREYLGGMLYAPGQGRDLPGGFLNLFTGWGVTAAPGDWSLMKRHILENVAQGVEEHALYITRWCAWAVQHPDDRAGVALVLQGKKGTGKGAFAGALVKMFGRHGRHVLQQDHVVGKFNAHLEYCSLLFADEAFAANQKQAESVLKGLVTESTLQVERKGVDTEPARNCLHIIVASNDEWVVPATEDERRWAVFKMSDAHAQDESYFRPLFEQMDAGGLAAMLHDLLAMDLGDWHPRRGIPQTDALTKQKMLSLRGVDRIMYQMLVSGNPVGCLAADAAGNRFFATEVLIKEHDGLEQKDYRSIGLQLKLASEDMHPDAPRLTLTDDMRAKHGLKSPQTRGRWLPPLLKARSLWAERKRLTISWPDDVADWQDAFGDDDEAGAGVPF